MYIEAGKEANACARISALRLRLREAPYRRKVKPNTHRRRDSTFELSRIGGVYTFETRWRQSRRVGGVNAHASAVVTQFTISCAIELLR